MKITDVRTYLIHQYLFVKVFTDEGIVGLGEIGAWGFPRAAEAVVRDVFKPYLVGEDPLRIERHWQFMTNVNHFRGTAVMAAVSGVDIALWDIAGKHFGTPVYNLLGGGYRTQIRTYCHILGETKNELMYLCKEKLEEGFTALGHLCPFIDTSKKRVADKSHAQRIADAVDLVAEIREMVGDEVDLCIECSRMLDPAEAIIFGNEVAPFHPLFLEDPIRPRNFDAMGEVAAHIPVPIATGERICSLQEFQMLINRRAVKYLRPNVTLCGGITGFRKIAILAEANDLKVVPHNPLSPVTTMASIHVAAVSGAFAIQEYAGDTRTYVHAQSGETFSLADIVTHVPELKRGYLQLPTAPGLGLELAEEAETRFPFAPYPVNMVQARDGSFTV